jgi:phosphocarrier protein HPr
MLSEHSRVPASSSLPFIEWQAGACRYTISIWGVFYGLVCVRMPSILPEQANYTSIFVIQRTVTIKNRAGLHTRPAAVIVKLASKFRSEFYIIKDGFRINGKSIIGVMTLAAAQGTELELECDGPDEETAMAELVDYFEKGFEEEM